MPSTDTRAALEYAEVLQRMIDDSTLRLAAHEREAIRYAAGALARPAPEERGDEPIVWLVEAPHSRPWLAYSQADADDYASKDALTVTPLYDHPAPAARGEGAREAALRERLELVEDALRAVQREAGQVKLLAPGALDIALASLASPPAPVEGERDVSMDERAGRLRAAAESLPEPWAVERVRVELPALLDRLAAHPVQGAGGGERWQRLRDILTDGGRVAGIHDDFGDELDMARQWVTYARMLEAEVHADRGGSEERPGDTLRMHAATIDALYSDPPAPSAPEEEP